MTANTDPDSGIAYGYISANALHSDTVQELQMNGTDVYYEEAWKGHVAEMKANYDAEMEDKRQGCLEEGRDFVEDNYDAFDPEEYRDSFNDSYSPDEPIHEGEKDGVKYRTSWLGGALNVWVFHSPFITHRAGRASPCVPNAGILDTQGNVVAYDVPVEWRRELWKYQISATAMKTQGDNPNEAPHVVGMELLLPFEMEPDDYFDIALEQLADKGYTLVTGHLHVTFVEHIEGD